MNRSFLQVNPMKQHPVIHTKFRTTANDFSFNLILNDRDGFIHLGYQANGLCIIHRISRCYFGNKQLTGIISISFHGKCSQRQQVNSITVFQCS